MDYINVIIFIANQMINDVTSIFRYNDSLGLNVDSFINKMIKFPKLKYLCTSKAPFYDDDGEILDDEKYDNDIMKLTQNVFDLKKSFVSSKDNDDIFTNISTLMMYRGFENIDH